MKIVAEFVAENKNTLKIVSTFVSMKRKTPESQCLQGFFSSGGSVARPLASRVPFGGALLKKTLHFRARFLLVDKRFEISNLDLVKDLNEVIDILE